MFTQSGWDNKRVNRSASVLTPIPCMSSNSIASIGKHTSTPMSPIIYRGADLTSNASIVRPNRMKQPERYSLSDTSYTTSTLNTSTDRQNSPTSIPNAAGPLLASSRYNIGMGTYADMHSPGFASRIVQYSGEYGESEHGRERITHLPKYGSPGLFPVVNLNKTPLKSIKPTAHRPVTVRIAPPDNSYNMDRSLILNQSLQSPTQQNNNCTSTQSEISTRSVLDALKEISRKRIHARDDSIEKNKRQRKSSMSAGQQQQKDSSIDTPLSSKRGRDIDVNNESSSFNGSNGGGGSSPSPKKYKQIKHGYNDIISSLSSSIHLRQQYANKRKSDPMTTKQSDINKQMKLGTITPTTSPLKSPEALYSPIKNTITIDENILPSTSSKSNQSLTNSKENSLEIPIKEKQLSTDNETLNKKHVENFKEGTIVNENGVCRLTFISNPPEKQNDIFVPFKPPTEESKRKRLAALLGALSGEEWDVKTLTKKFFPSENEEVDSSPKSPGILVPAGKSSDVKKHVTFNLPPASPSPSSGDHHQIELSTPISLPSGNPIMNKSEITTTSVSITQPISSTMSFGANNNVSITPTSDPPTNTILFGNTQQSPQIIATSTAVPTSTPVKFGTPEVTKPINFNSSTKSTSLATPTITFGAPTTTLQPTINFGSKTTDSAPQTTLNFSANLNQSNVGSKSPSTGGFHFDLNKKPETSSAPVVGMSNSNTSKFSFGATNDAEKKDENKSFASPFGTAAFTPKTTVADNTTIVPSNPGFSFGNTATKDDKPQGNTFGTPKTVSFGTPNSAFSIPKTTSNITSPFGASNVPAFGTPTTSNPAVNPPVFGTGLSSTTNVPAFGTPTTTAASISFGAATQAVPSFGNTTTTTANNAPLFGSTTTTSNTFGNTNTSSFGKPATNNLSFGQTTATPAFGTPTTTNAAPSFGSTTPAFGSTSTGFGVTTTTNSSFGASTTPFGSTSNVTSPFGNSAPQFGTPTTSSNTFGATNTGFGTPTTTAQFGASTTPAVLSPFGSSATPSTAPPAFGAQTTQASGFGTQSTTTTGGFSTTPIFGATTQQTNNAFGSSTAPTGNTTNIFGSNNNNNNTTNAFGATTNTSTFGNNAPTNKPFGSPNFAFSGTNTTTQNNNNAFGSSSGFGNTQSNVFGSNNTDNKPPAFGSTSTPVFGAQNNNNNNNNIFGSTTQASNAATTNTSVFGATNQTTPVTFGSTDNKPAGFGGFGNNNNNNAASGGSTTSGGVFAFGSQTATSNTTNTNNTFQFGAPKPAASGGFNFSASSSTVPSNFNANSATPAFGNGGGTPAFGTNQFSGAPGAAPNMFSIGTGSTAPRPRATSTRYRKK